MIRIYGNQIKPIYVGNREGEGSILYNYTNVSKVKQHLHFVAKKSIETELKEIIGPLLIRK